MREVRRTVSAKWTRGAHDVKEVVQLLYGMELNSTRRRERMVIPVSQ